MANLEARLDWRMQHLRDEWIAYSVLVLWLLWIALPFYGISMTTQDQLDFSLAGTAPDYWQEVWNAAVSQGRIYFLFTKSIDHFVAAYPELLAIKLVNWSAFLLSVVAFSYIVFRNLAHGVLFVWVFFCLVWIGYAHQPPAAYPLVNHVPFLLLALTTFAIRRAAVSERRRPLWWGMVFFCSFLSFFQYEPLTAFALVVLLWVIHSGDMLNHRCRLRAYQTVLIAFLLYLSLYVIWSVSFPSNYDGAERGTLSLVTLFRVWVAYTLGAVTGLAGVTFDTQLLWGDSDIGVANLHYGRALLDQSDRIFTLLFTVLAAVLVYRLLKSSCMENQGQSRISYLMKVWVFVVLALGALNGPIALSAKYQSWADSWVEPYLTSHLALYPLVFLIVTTLTWVIARFKQWAAIILAAFLFIFGSSAVLMHEQNQAVAIKMRTFVNKWEAISMVAECRDQLSSEDYIAPQFYYSTYQKALDWHRYWRQYASQRYGVSVNLWAQASDRFNPALSIYQDDRGRLQMVAVQSEHEFHVLGTGSLWPNLFLDQSGRQIKVDFERYSHCGESGYRIWTVKTDQNHVKPVWGVPQQPAFRDFSVLKYAIGTSVPPANAQIELISGWHELEREHVWSNGLASVFRIPLPSKHTSPAVLRIYGFYFAGAEKTGVYVNNQYLGSFVLGAEKITLPKSSLAGDDLKVELRHTHPTSPKALGMSEDVREFKFGLSRVYLEVSNEPAALKHQASAAK